jgi:hypothetical protein
MKLETKTTEGNTMRSNQRAKLCERKYILNQHLQVSADFSSSHCDVMTCQ